MQDMTLPALASGDSPAVGWRYSRTAIVLHWLLALLIALTTAIGWRMMLIKRQPGSEQLFDLHKSIGLIIAAFVVARVLWRLSHRPGPLPAGPVWSARLAAIAHVLLYLFMVLLPITGYLGASYSKAGVRWFGLATPRWTLPDHDLAERFFTVHGVLLWSFVVLVALHVLGGLKHLLLDKDRVFQRMWFARRP
jgi:cytochrome b561